MRIESALNKKGITLIELLVAMIISAAVIAGIYRVFVAQTRAYTVQEQVVEVQQGTRSAMEILLRDLRMAGFDSDDAGSKINIANPIVPGDNSITVSYEYDYSTQHIIAYSLDAGTKRLIRQLTTMKDDGSSVASPQDVLLENVEALDFTYGVDTNGDGALDNWVPKDGIGIGKVVAVRVVLTGNPDQTNPDVKNWVSPRTLNSAVTLRNLSMK
jgi:type IV pilus assembly protein PilW